MTSRRMLEVREGARMPSAQRKVEFDEVRLAPKRVRSGDERGSG